MDSMPTFFNPNGKRQIEDYIRVLALSEHLLQSCGNRSLRVFRSLLTSTMPAELLISERVQARRELLNWRFSKC